MRETREVSGARDTGRGLGSRDSVRGSERIPEGAVAAAERVQLERTAHVAHLDPEDRVRARPPREVEALEEERVRAADRVRSERVPDAHAHAERGAELVREPRHLERTRAGATPARAHAHRGGEVEPRG